MKLVLSIRVPADLKEEFLQICEAEGLSNAEMLAHLVGLYTASRCIQVPPQTPLPSHLTMLGESDLVDSRLVVEAVADAASAAPVRSAPQVKRSVASTSAKRIPSPEKKHAKAARFGNDSFAFAQAFYDALDQRDALPEQKGWYMRQVAYADAMLKSGKITLQEALSCLSWALADEWWGVHLTSLSQLATKVWPVYQRKKDGNQQAPQWMNDLLDWVDERNKEG